MDPLSITASIIAVLQATTAVLSICYDYRSAIKHHPWGLAKAIDEVRDLRNILESLELLSSKSDDGSDTRLSNLRLLCKQETGPLQGCLAELHQLEKKITSPKWSNQLGKRRKALIQAIGWQVKDGDVQQSLQHLNRFKTTLNLALTADEA
jgi:Fungal N-terminal domain of STAND proteins